MNQANLQESLPHHYTSPPPQNEPSPQNLQNQHNPDHASTASTRTSLNNKRSPAPRLRSRGQIVSLCDQRRAKAALLYDRCGRGVADNDCTACISAVAVYCGLRGCYVLRC
jgi:hypothetical protein